MPKRLLAGRIRAPGKEIRRFRESIPKTIAEVAADGELNERTVLNAEQNATITFDTLSRIAKGLGVEYARLLAVARAEIPTLAEPERKKVRVILTVEGDFQDEALHAPVAFLKRLAAVIQATYPFDDSDSAKGSVRISVLMDSDDFERAKNAFENGLLKALGIVDISEDSGSYYIRQKGQLSGPFTFEQITRMKEQGRIPSNARVVIATS